MYRDILLDIPIRWLGVSAAASVSAAKCRRHLAVAAGDPRPQAPDRALPRLSNTPDGVALPLPLVAHSRTSAREVPARNAPGQGHAKSGENPSVEMLPVAGSSMTIPRPVFRA